MTGQDDKSNKRDKRNTQGQHKGPTRRLIKKEGGRRPSSKMTRVTRDDKRSRILGILGSPGFLGFIGFLGFLGFLGCLGGSHRIPEDQARIPRIPRNTKLGFPAFLEALMGHSSSFRAPGTEISENPRTVCYFLSASLPKTAR